MRALPGRCRNRADPDPTVPPPDRARRAGLAPGATTPQARPMDPTATGPDGVVAMPDEPDQPADSSPADLAAPSHLEVPWAVRVAAEWSWRLLAIAAAVVGLALLADRLKLLILALFVAT